MVEVTDSQPVFTKRDLLPYVAESFPEGTTSADLALAVDRVLEAAVARGEAIPLADHTPAGRWWLSDDALFTTRTQLDREQAVLSAVHQPSPVRIDADVLDRAAKLRELTRQQESAVRRLARLDGRVVTVAGPGGSGKTYAIGAYADAAQAAGHNVIGVATTASAAQRLSQDLPICVGTTRPAPTPPCSLADSSASWSETMSEIRVMGLFRMKDPEVGVPLLPWACRVR